MAKKKADKTKENEAALLRDALLRDALRWTHPVEPDLAAPNWNGNGGPILGYRFNAFSQRVGEAWSSPGRHGDGHVPALVGDRRSHQVASQGSIPLYSTRRLALMALRHELEKVAAQTLRNIDQLLEAETGEGLVRASVDLARFRVERPAGGAS